VVEDRGRQVGRSGSGAGREAGQAGEAGRQAQKIWKARWSEGKARRQTGARSRVAVRKWGGRRVGQAGMRKVQLPSILPPVCLP